MAERYILEGTRENFSTLVLENSAKGVVVVDFWAPWAGPSLRQRELLINLAEEYGGRFLLVSVNTDEQKRLAEDYQVKSLPSIKLFYRGKVVEELRGMQPEADYRTTIDKYASPVAETVQLSAARAWNEGDQDKAIQILVEGAMEEPENLALPDMLAKLLMRQSRHQQAYDMLDALPLDSKNTENIATLLSHLSFMLTAEAAEDSEYLQAAVESNPDDHATRYKIAAVALLADDYQESLEALIEILRRDRSWEEDKARRGLLAIFETLGSDHELVRKYRSELFRLIH